MTTTHLEDARQCLDRRDLDGALTCAAIAAGQEPDCAEAFGLIGYIQMERHDYYHAADAFDRFYRLRSKSATAAGDDLFFDGAVPTAACRVYAAVGKLDQALQCQRLISPMAAVHPDVSSLYFPVQGEVMRQVGWDRVQAMVEYLIWDTEPIKAMRFLQECIPAALSDQPRIAEMRRALQEKMRHLNSWEAYKAEYDAIPSETFHTKTELHDFVHNLGRTKNVVAWAKQLPAEGPPVQVLAVGFQDGIIESDAMEQNARIRLTVCDVSPHANMGLKMLQERFPGRVSTHTIAKNHYDWSTEGALFDAIFIFEVLEHLPSDIEALHRLRGLLKDDGVLFLSTPIAERWVEPYLTGAKGPTWYGHVRAHNPMSLHQLARNVGFEDSMESTDQGGVFFCRLQRGLTTRSRKVSIYVHGTPHPFDPDSHLRGHLGGSEEAVLYLAPALFRLGYEVTVYTPRPARGDGCAVLSREGVAWRHVDEFDVGGDHQRVLFWRCPSLLSNPVLQDVPYKKYLWLHDTHYRSGSKAYDAADGVIVLSKFHGEILRERDGYAGPLSYAANGIDLDMFPPLTDVDETKRDPYKCIYGSSPDRGLDRVIRAWPMIKRAVPQATLDVYYTWDLFDRAVRKYPEVGERFGTLRADAEKLADQGVTIKGGVDHRTLSEAYRRAGLWVYPTAFEEIHCLSAAKSQAAGCWPMCTAYAALKETADGYCLESPEGLDLDSPAGAEWYAGKVIERMTHPPTAEERHTMSDAARARFGWDHVATMFDEIIR